MTHILDLDGCAPTPLAHYLKALGILRLVAEQADPNARGWWSGDRFRLATTLDRDELATFFLDDYEPTPLLAPWNGASGFFRTWDNKKKSLRNNKNLEALQTLVSLDADRWKPLRDAYEHTVTGLRAVLKTVDVSRLSNKERSSLLIFPDGCGPRFPVADKENDKHAIQQTMAILFSSNGFYRSAINVGEETGYPSLWGSGANDGAIDFTGRFFENLQICLTTEGKQSAALLRSALFAGPANNLQTGAGGKVGQFLPSGAGGANSTTGPGTQNDTLLNPWDYVLMMEGAVVLTSHVSRQFRSNSPKISAPFVVASGGAGYASASGSDESARGEQWMPLWSQPMSFGELRRLLAEGRAQLGARPVREPLDMARAVARLGVARGVHAFQRYGYIERNGQSNLAVPLGRYVVATQSTPRLACLDDLDVWLPRIRREARSDNAPARLRSAQRALGDTLFAVAQHPGEASRWQSLLLALGAVESVQKSGSGIAAGPIPRLRPEWVEVANDRRTSEFRLAVAFALQQIRLGKAGRIASGSIRKHWLPLDKKYDRRFAVSSRRLDIRPEVIMQGLRGEDDAIALVRRALIEAAQRGERGFPLHAAPRAAASVADLAALTAGEIDLDRTLALARPLMALDAKQWKAHPAHMESVPAEAWPDDAWLAIRLALFPWPKGDERARLGADPAIVARLAAGDAASAAEIALRRLRATGLNPSVRIASATPHIARHWAAALAFPISTHTAKRFLLRLDSKAAVTNHIERSQS